MSDQDLAFLPRETLEARAYWDGCRAGRLMVQRCAACGRHQFYSRAVCSHCGSWEVAHTQVSGRATVHASTVVHRPPHPRFAGRVPYVVALVDLDEGPRMMTMITGCAPADVHTGMPVEVVFEQVATDITLPMFAPVAVP